MAVRIKSLLASGPVMVPLVSGVTVRLSPGQVSHELPDVEVTDNAKVTKLRDRGLIEVEDVSKPRPKGRGRSSGKSGGKSGESGGEPADGE